MVEVVLAGPGKNALGSQMMRSLAAELERAAGAPVLIRGEGDAFSAGLDLKEVAGLDAAGMEAFLRLLDDTMAAVRAYPGPIAAAVTGHAIAGGSILALCCDHAVGPAGASRARIGLNEVALGLRFPPRILRIVLGRVPPGALDEVVLGAGLHSPEDALRLGLLDALAADPVAAATAWLERVGRHPADAYAAAKRDLRGTLEMTAEEDRWFREDVLPMWTTDALKERVRAVLGGGRKR